MGYNLLDLTTGMPTAHLIDLTETVILVNVASYVYIGSINPQEQVIMSLLS